MAVVSDTSFLDSGTVAVGDVTVNVTFDSPIANGGDVQNYVLQRAGSDHKLTDIDPLVWPTAATMRGNTVTLEFPPFEEDVYRLLVMDGLRDNSGFSFDGDGDGQPGGIWFRDFVVNQTTSSSKLISAAIHSSRYANNTEEGFGRQISADGNRIVFASAAANLVSGDDNGQVDIFVRDLLNQTTTLVTASSKNVLSNGYSSRATISANGRYVAFTSYATNLIDSKTSQPGGVYVKDLLTGSLVAASSQTSSSDVVAGDEPSLSADGRYVVFTCQFQLQDSTVTPGNFNVYVKDLQTGDCKLVSGSSTGVPGNGWSSNPQINDDGSMVVFASRAENLVDGDSNHLSDVFVKDLASGGVSIVSVDTQGKASDGASDFPSISHDGRYVAFRTNAKNLSDAHSQFNDFFVKDIYVKDLLTSNLYLVTSTNAGVAGNAIPFTPIISSDGRYVVFGCLGNYNAVGPFNFASTIFRKDTQTGTITAVAPSLYLFDGINMGASVSDDGGFISFRTHSSLVSDDEAGADTYRFNVQSGAYDIVTVANSSLAGATANGLSMDGAINHDGGVVAFYSQASNVLNLNVGPFGQVYARNTATGEVQLVSSDAQGVPSNGNSSNPSISANGQWIAFQSLASNLVTTDTNFAWDVYVKNIKSGAIERVSIAENGTEPNDFSWHPSISGDGRYVAFESQASTFDSNDRNGERDIYVKDRQTGKIVRASTNSSGVDANGYSESPAISADGKVVVFTSNASNLASNDSNFFVDIFAKNLVTGELTLVSANANGIGADLWSDHPSISADGRYVFFESSATNLVSDDTNAQSDIFRKDLLTGEIIRVSTDSNGQQADDGSFSPTVSSDGNSVLFASRSGLDLQSTDHTLKLFVKILATGEVSSVFTRPDGQPLILDVSYPSHISGDGNHAVVTYAASDAVAADRNGFPDVFSIRLHAMPAVKLTDTNGKVFDIDTAGANFGAIIQGPNNAFDGYNQLVVNDIGYRSEEMPTVVDSNQTVVTPTVSMSGLNVSRKVYVPSSGPISFVRTIDSFTNPTSAPIVATVASYSNLGSDFKIGPDMRTIVYATSDGDLDVEPTDTWFATDDSDPTGGTPAIVHFIHGTFHDGPTETSIQLDNVSSSLTLTVNPGQTVRTAFFVIVAANRNDALAAAIQIEVGGKLSADALKYVSTTERDSIINFQDNPIQITIDKTTIREDGGNSAATITITRIGDLTQPITVQLSSSDTTEATVPLTATIPVGASSVQVKVSAIADHLLDGSQPVILQATKAGVLLGVVSLTVDDAEFLLLQPSSTSITEKDGTTTATVTRSNTDIASAIEATISVSVSGSLNMPTKITIPAGESSATFQILSIDNYLFDGDRDISIAVSFVGYIGSTSTLKIIDEESKRPGTNPYNAMNVNNDAFVDPLDVLCIVNVINRGIRPIAINGDGNFYDVDGDLQTTPLDVLVLVNYLNGRGSGNAEGEAGNENERYSFATVDLDPTPTSRKRSSVRSVDRVFQDSLWQS